MPANLESFRTFLAYDYWAVTIYGAPFQETSSSPVKVLQGPHHIFLMFPSGIQFALPGFRSPLLTGSQLLSFPAGTKMFQFPAFPSPEGTIRKSLDQRLLAPTQGLSQLATSFIGNQAKPSTVWFNLHTLSGESLMYDFIHTNVRTAFEK